MPLQPQVQEFIEAQLKIRTKPVRDMSIMEYRNTIKAAYGNSKKIEELKQVEDRYIVGPHGKIPIKIYTPSNESSKAALIYLKGSGFVSGDLDEQDSLCRAIANRAKCKVIAVAYRAAPEYKYPIGFDDSYAVTKWVIMRGDEFQIDSKRVSVCGYSSGGNFAALIALKCREEGIPLQAQILLCPCLDLSCSMSSHARYSHGYLLDVEDVQWYLEQYLPENINVKSPKVSPLWENKLSELPSTLIISAECDPLHDEAELYADNLKRAGVEVEYYCYQGHIHAMFACRELFSFTIDPVDKITDFLIKINQE